MYLRSFKTALSIIAERSSPFAVAAFIMSAVKFLCTSAKMCIRDRDDSAYLYVLCIKLAVDGKNLLVELQYARIIVLSVSLLWVQLEVELITLSQVYHLLFESWQGKDVYKRQVVLRSITYLRY